jgi:hypothetical protein
MWTTLEHMGIPTLAYAADVLQHANIGPRLLHSLVAQ